MWETRKTKLYDSCPSKLQSQHSAENLAGTKGKCEGKSLLYGNVNVNKGKESLVGLAVGDNNNCMQFDGIALPIIVGTWPMAVSLWRHVECLLLLLFYVVKKCSQPFSPRSLGLRSSNLLTA